MRNTPVNFQGKTNYDSELCGSIPLNYINLIQAHGALLVLEHTTFTIVQASENIEQILGVTVQQVLQEPLKDFIGDVQLQQLSEKLQPEQAKNHLSLSLRWLHNKKILSATLHNRSHYLLLELEEVVEQKPASLFAASYQDLSYVIASLKEATTVEEVSVMATAELQRLSDFDRVMIYRFDETWNGTVIAETQAPDMADSYLGLHFPASDVPK